jgi:hypothetical protein
VIPFVKENIARRFKQKRIRNENRLSAEGHLITSNRIGCNRDIVGQAQGHPLNLIS